jgi:hypothetical protein
VIDEDQHPTINLLLTTGWVTECIMNISYLRHIHHDFDFLTVVGKFVYQDLSLLVMDAAAALEIPTKGKWARGRLGNTGLEGD